jgi:hypothetical protein
MSLLRLLLELRQRTIVNLISAVQTIRGLEALYSSGIYSCAQTTQGVSDGMDGWKSAAAFVVMNECTCCSAKKCTNLMA